MVENLGLSRLLRSCWDCVARLPGSWFCLFAGEFAGQLVFPPLERRHRDPFFLAELSHRLSRPFLTFESFRPPLNFHRPVDPRSITRSNLENSVQEIPS